MFIILVLLVNTGIVGNAGIVGNTILKALMRMWSNKWVLERTCIWYNQPVY